MNPVDDPTTVLDERNTCRRNYINKNDEEHVIKGYVIPVDDLETLEDGSLPTLFGWESVDLAAYFRDTIAPLLDDPGLTRFDDDQGSTDPALTLPVTHVMLYQIQTPISLTSEDDCAGAGSVAAYWGITEEGGTIAGLGPNSPTASDSATPTNDGQTAVRRTASDPPPCSAIHPSAPRAPAARLRSVVRW